MYTYCSNNNNDNNNNKNNNNDSFNNNNNIYKNSIKSPHITGKSILDTDMRR